MTAGHRLALAAAATLVAGGLALALTVAGDRGETAEDAARIVFSLVIGWSFALCGLLAWSRRPANRFGALMVAVGLTWFAGSLVRWQEPVPVTIAAAVQVVPLAILAHLLLAFPSGRLDDRRARLVALAGYVAAVPGQLAWLLFRPFEDGPENAMRALSPESVGVALQTAQRAAGVAIIAAIVWLVAAHWRVSGVAGRRALAPVLSSGAAVFVALAVYIVGQQFSDPLEHVGNWLLLVALACVPLAFVVGLLDARLAHSAAVARLVAELRSAPGPGAVRDALARALGDPTLELAFRVGAGEHVGPDGRALEVPEPRPGARRVATPVEHDGVPVATLVHDAALRERPGLLQTVAGTASFALENARLTAEVRARVEELRASEERLRALIDAAPAAIVELDADGRVTLWNDAAERMYGWRADEVLGGPVLAVPDELREEIAATYARVQAGETVQLRTRRLRRDGRWIDVEIAAAPIRDASGAVVRQMGIATDVTARTAAEAAVRRERDFSDAVVDTAPSLVLVFDRAGRIVRFNRTCEEVTGYRADEVVGHGFWDIFLLPEERDRVRVALDRVWEGDFPSENENVWRTRDGVERLVHWTNMALLSATGEVEYIVSHGVDVTEQRQYEAELRASRARIVEAGDRERRRLERNLHDGAQQRLVALSLTLRMAEAQVAGDGDGPAATIAAAREELNLAITELRELARGIHPAVLTDRGLDAALEALAARSPLPVEVKVDTEGRLPGPVEVAAYYVVAESLANVAKYAGATSAGVAVALADGCAVVEVSDDGVGGADPSAGSGLRGLADRVAALEGSLEVESPPGGGTRVRAVIPLESA